MTRAARPLPPRNTQHPTSPQHATTHKPPTPHPLKQPKPLNPPQYQPKALDKFVLHQGIAANLKKLVATGDCPHALFYGPPGAGKRTLVAALLREIYGPGAERVRVETRPWTVELPSRKLEVELTTVSSNYHVELSPGDVGGSNDRYVVQEVIKDLAKNRPLDVATGAGACARARARARVGGRGADRGVGDGGDARAVKKNAPFSLHPTKHSPTTNCKQPPPQTKHTRTTNQQARAASRCSCSTRSTASAARRSRRCAARWRSTRPAAAS